MVTEFFMKTSRDCRVVIAVSFIAVMAILAYDWVVSPKRIYLQTAAQHQALSDIMKEKLGPLSNSVKIKTGRLSKLEEEFTSNRRSLMSSACAVEFFGKIESAVSKSGCNFESLIFVDEKKVTIDKEALDALTVIKKTANLEFNASYSSIVSFLKNLSSRPEVVSLDGLTIELADAAKGLSCEVDITVYTYQS